MKTNFLIFVLMLTTLVSCQQHDENANVEDLSIPTDSVIDAPQAHDETYMFPSPLQIAVILKKAGLTYQPGITNDLTKVNQYETKLKQKLNFGVYAADLAYLVLNKQNQEAINTIKTLDKLSEKLWMTNLFSNLDIMKRFERNLDNEDSLVTIIADLQMTVDDYLETNGLKDNAAVIFAGAWIETMYIASKVNQTKPKEELIKRLGEQKLILKQIIDALKLSEEHDYSDLIDKLNTLYPLFPEIQENTEDANNGNNIEKDSYKLSDEQLKEISRIIENLRNEIVTI